jgi:hypothetical protein
MIRRKGRQSEHLAYLKKFLEHGKDPLKRLKALKHGLEKAPLSEVKEFHTEHASTVFYVFYSSFSTVEAAIQERGLWSCHGYAVANCSRTQNTFLAC